MVVDFVELFLVAILFIIWFKEDHQKGSVWLPYLTNSRGRRAMVVDFAEVFLVSIFFVTIYYKEDRQKGSECDCRV